MIKSVSFILLITALFVTFPCFPKRPKNKPKPDINQQIDNQDKPPHVYQPNPIVLAGVSQIMNGALNIAQDPHNRPNIGHSVASMVHGIVSIIIEKLARKKIDIYNGLILKKHLNKRYLENIIAEITYIIDKEFSHLV